MTKERVYFQKMFRILKPACDAFITEPNNANTKYLKNTLTTIPDDALEQFQPYILIPLDIHLKTNKCVLLYFIYIL